MTTKVKIEIVQAHMPVIVEVLRSDGSISTASTLSAIGVSVQDYVHSRQTLRVREMTTEEMHYAARLG
jgi:hypothetical protein